MAPNVWLEITTERMTEEDLPRLRATRGAKRGVITKLIGEANTILEDATSELDIKTRNKLSRIEGNV